jgi:sulfofructose kinase
MTRPPRLIAVGAVCSTRIYRIDDMPSLPSKVLPREAVQIADGMAVSAACAFVRLGGAAEIWARTGADEQAVSMAAELAAEGLDVTNLRAVPGTRSSHACVVVDRHGDRLVLPFHDPACDPSADWLPLGRLAEADFLLCDMRWPEGAGAALRAARHIGLPTMLDADIAPLGSLHRLVPLADHVVFSDQALTLYTGEPGVEAGLRRVAATHPGCVGVSCGRDGYYWLDGTRLRHVPAPPIEVVDTLAAGDVLHGALALALAEGRPMPEAAAFAVTAASLKCTRFGGRLGCPTRPEVLALLGKGACRNPSSPGEGHEVLP